MRMLAPVREAMLVVPDLSDLRSPVELLVGAGCIFGDCDVETLRGVCAVLSCVSLLEGPPTGGLKTAQPVRGPTCAATYLRAWRGFRVSRENRLASLERICSAISTTSRMCRDAGNGF